MSLGMMQITPATGGEGRGLETVLVVDDYLVDSRRAGAIVAKIPGMRAAYADGGASALDAIDRLRPAAVLTDLQMPGMDGLALVQEIRSRHPEIPVILMTAHGSEEIAMRALRAGATNYVPKRRLAADLAPTLRQIATVAAAGHRRRFLLGRMESQVSRFELENDPRLIAPLVEVLQRDLDRMGLCDETALMRVGIALQENLANALYHGNLGVSSDLRQEDEDVFYAEAEDRRHRDPYRSRAIRIEAAIDRDSARYVVRDEGDGFDTSALDRPIDPEDLMRVGGRGLLLIRTFMDEVTFNAEGNVITLVKRGANLRPADPAS